eukprot:5433334-Heterocapsa_arctica.AAC.1
MYGAHIDSGATSWGQHRSGELLGPSSGAELIAAAASLREATIAQLRAYSEAEETVRDEDGSPHVAPPP